MKALFMLLAVLCTAVYSEKRSASQVQLHSQFGRKSFHEVQELQELYLWTLKYSLTGVLLETPYYAHAITVDLKNMQPFNEEARFSGRDWPAYGLTMVGVKRLENLQTLITHLINTEVPGDFVECGVWRGGSSIFMRGVLKALNVRDRVVHLVDSFDGLPTASTAEDHNLWIEMDYLKVPKEKVEAAFKRYNLLDNQVEFHKGYFRESLPNFRKSTGNRSIALLRLDGDMYESTMDILFNLADFLSPGACVVVDDWFISECQKAMKEFFDLHHMNPTIVPIDYHSVYFCVNDKIDVQRSWYDKFNSNRSQ